MRSADTYTIEDYGLPSFTLMETAGRGGGEAIQSAYGPLDGEAVMILCGKGNNGGDGLVVARRLCCDGAQVHVVLTGAPDELSDDAAHNLTLLKRLRSEDVGDRLTIETLDTLGGLAETANRLAPTLYVDALLGTGLTSDLREPMRSLVEWVNDRATPIVAVDVPTGLHSDTGAVLGEAVQAERTITMAAPKVGLYLGEGPARAGDVDVVDIGIPPFVIDRVARESGCVRRTTDAAVRRWWPDRAPDAYKYSVGTAVVVGGSDRYPGAPTLASTAAVRSGAGYVPSSTDDGVSPEAVEQVANQAPDAVLVGPGLGRGSATHQFVRRFVATTDRSLVIDADGLNALADGGTEWTEHADRNWILTPHEGEFRRLAGEVDLSDRVTVVQEYARTWNVVLLLKGNPSIVAGPEGRTYVSSTGTSALATAGTGDVLAGQCVGLLAQGLDPVPAAAAALHLGGAAAQRYADTRDPRTMAAPDLVEELPRATRERLGRSRS